MKINQEVCKKPWQIVESDDRVFVNGIGIHHKETRKKQYVALYKPSGYVTTNSDPYKRTCAIDLLRPIYKQRLFHVGRLDKNSSGLIFFTDDGDFSQAIQHPSRKIEKEYQIKTSKKIPEFILKHWQRGIVIEGIRYQLKYYKLLGQREALLVLIEGRNREIRRVFEHFHIRPKVVNRIRIGKIRIKGLSPGASRPLTQSEVKSLQKDQKDEAAYTEHKQETFYEKKIHRISTERKNQEKVEQGLYNTPSIPYQKKTSTKSFIKSRTESASNSRTFHSDHSNKVQTRKYFGERKLIQQAKVKQAKSFTKRPLKK